MSRVPVSLPILADHSQVLAAFSTRLGGESLPPYAELNIGLHVGDTPSTVLANRRRWGKAVGFSAAHLTCGQQVHGVQIQRVTATDRGRGATSWSEAFADTDGLITDVPELPLLTVVADCAAVYVYDPVHHVVGLGHAGWRGALNGLVFSLLDTLNNQFGTQASQVVTAIGPCIGVECYQVGPEVVSAFQAQWGKAADQFFDTSRGERLHFNLKATLSWQLTQLGVPAAQQDISPDCTSCHLDRFYSHRAEHGQTGRLGAVIMLKARPEKVR